MNYQSIHRFGAIGFFIICILIVLYSHELGVWRGFIGDIMIIILLYLVWQSIQISDPYRLTGIILLTAFMVEGLQYIHIGDIVGWNHIPIVKIIFGSTFDFYDLMAYITGGSIITMIDTIWIRGYISASHKKKSPQ